ncbi:uncharacterized protein LOC107788816 isoform X1 [Nicotiana tabacum]|uniref:Uncharacterized protein LOC107788816 isoform X1 n=1 Tax=Nicotiana tabacum TaxID=4097 RepID=A0AC58UE07_TOBAC|nr:uncharacterized ATP-dependent helicase YprA isoform X2 [Nicotiana tomentosiformis]
MEESETSLEVRSLMGESVIVSVSPDKTIQELKQLLKQTFPPASNSPNFHLFLKGVKLGLESKVSDHSVVSGEFLVLVPYTKKDRQQNKKTETPTSSTILVGGSTLKQAEAAWSDMMQDLSYLSGISADDNQTELRLDATHNSSVPANCSSQVKRKRSVKNDKMEGYADELVLSILKSSTNDMDDEKAKIFVQVLASINCFTNPGSGDCACKEANRKDNAVDPCSSFSDSCGCPTWLKSISKVFSFLNVYSASLQLQQVQVTYSSLKGALDHLCPFGFQASVADIEQLSLLCPKVVHIVDADTEVKNFKDGIVIFRNSTTKGDQHATQKGVPISSVLHTMKKREYAFRTSLLKFVKLLKRENGNEFTKISLEDFITFVKQGGVGATGIDTKRAGSHSFEANCCDTNPLTPLEMVEHLRRGFGSDGQVVHVEKISARNATYVEIPSSLSESTMLALKNVGVTRLYSHQAESIQASLGGKNVVVATLTSSGKSLCYNVPVLEVLSQNLSACALYLFPTKALAQDQLRSLLTMTNEFSAGFRIGVYDGDTSQTDRRWLRDNARLLITNPDMLHVSILPCHRQFSRILSNLRFVIVDEAHSYKGAFGCHTALILRRLCRLCSHVYGSNPSFIFSTATSGNPVEHSKELSNLPTMELIQNDGSPSGSKLFVLWNPPLRLKMISKRIKSGIDDDSVDKHLIARRSSPILEVSCLFAEMMQHGLRCIAFCKTRKLCELVLCYTREILQETSPHLVDTICAYRAGYVAEDRRRIEHDFFNGSICGIAATSALELGIDVGHIDATLHLGFPGSIASLWQQAGRSGRRGNASLAIYVAFEGPLDQYFMKFPQKLFRGPIECCHIDARNRQVLEQHLAAAAFEYPLSLSDDEKYFGPGLESLIMALKNKGILSTDISRSAAARIWSYIGLEIPSSAISIRAIETERYKVIDMQKNEVLEEIEESKAFFQVYEGANYMNQGKTYLVKELDVANRIAWCQRADLKYYTKTRDFTDVHVTGANFAYPAITTSLSLPRTTAQAHSCRVTTTWFGFRKIWKKSNQVFDTVELSLPNYTYETQAVWIQVPQTIKTAVETLNYSFRGGLHAAGHALLNVVPMYIICNSSDLASECVNPYDTRNVPERILLYDPHPGGTGISAQVQPLFSELLTAALELLASCRCSGDTGCPNCVQNISCHEYNEVLHKDAAIIIIKGVLEEEESFFRDISELS